jgi:hypothetical protein
VRRGISARAVEHAREPSMSRYAVGVGFTLVFIWIAVVFVLISGTHTG